MSNKAFWDSVAKEWCKTTDGINIPSVGIVDVSADDMKSYEKVSDSEVDDILSDLGF